MENTDTIMLLRECDAGTKMAISSIDEILDRICSSNMRQALQESKQHHERLKKQITSILNKYQSEEKEPGAIAKSMSWIKTNLKMGVDSSDATVADLITDGCNMGVKSLNRYLNQYETADRSVKDLCSELISIEEKLCQQLRQYL